jgi:hypothetical protein
MSKYVAAGFWMALVIAPASAVDLGVSTGSVDVDAGATVEKNQGASVGVSGEAGGTGVDAGASVGSSGGSVDTGIGAGSNSAGVTGSNSDGESGGTTGQAGGTDGGNGTAGIERGDVSVGHTAGGSTGQMSKQSVDTSQSGEASATTAGIVPRKGSQQLLVLPRILLPRGSADRAGAAPELEARPGTPDAVVRTCRGAVEAAARPYGAIRVGAKSSGPLRRLSGGVVSAPVHVRIEYHRQGGLELRQARIKCQLDAAGRVVKLI